MKWNPIFKSMKWTKSLLYDLITELVWNIYRYVDLILKLKMNYSGHELDENAEK